MKIEHDLTMTVQIKVSSYEQPTLALGRDPDDDVHDCGDCQYSVFLGGYEISDELTPGQHDEIKRTISENYDE